MADVYIGNISYRMTEEDIKTMCERTAPVLNITIIRDRKTDKPKGYCFVEVGTEEEANAMVAALDSREVFGRRIRASIAKPQRYLKK